MAPSQHLWHQSARLESFKNVTKRGRRTTASKQSTNPTWPHATPTPDQLASAGFFYSPTASDLDNVKCYLCSRSLDGWDPEDVPDVEHLRHSPDCGWAIKSCIARKEPSIMEEGAHSERIEQARRMTFMSNWPYEKKKGWIPKVAAMVSAGWFYCPTEDANDLVTCPYCDLWMDGWEKDDDPLHEHQSGAPGCFFLQHREARILENAEIVDAPELSTESSVISEAMPPTPPLKTVSPHQSPPPPLPPVVLQPAAPQPAAPQSTAAQSAVPQAVAMTLAQDIFMSEALASAPTPVSAPGQWQGIDFDSLLRPIFVDDPRSGPLQPFDVNELMGITSPEMDMSIEAWMNQLAQHAEGKLSSECEAVIAQFEAEGQKAVHRIEAMDCS